MGRMPTIQVPRGAIVGLVVTLMASVVAVAFLVGRESVRTSPQAPPTQPAAQAAVPPGQVAPAPNAAGASPWPSDSPERSLATSPTMAPPAPQGPSFNSSPPPFAQPAPTTDKLRDEVARYFREVETIQSQAKTSGDPETFARTLLEQGMKGDASGFDGLVAANRKVLDALGAVEVPEPCREHHRLTLRLLEQSIAMLGNVKGQLQGGNEASLAALPAQGQELERGAKEADALAADIKRRFGL
jgi:hypothetical protein